MKPIRLSRSEAITPDHRASGQTIEVYNGRLWVKLRPSKEILGRKCGEFSKTRTQRSMNKGKKGKKK